MPTYHRRVTVAAAPNVHIEPLPRLGSVSPVDVAEAFRDLPGLALLEAARPGRNARWSYLTADPLSVVDEPSPGDDPLAAARVALARLASERSSDRSAPPFVGGLVGYLSYDLGRRYEHLPEIAAADQDLPLMRLGLHDWVVAWDRATGTAWLGGRVADGDVGRQERRLADVRRRLEGLARGRPRRDPPELPHLELRSGLSREAYEARVRDVRAAIARGEIYQANLTRRLETPFSGDPWPLYGRLREGDPALFAAYLDLGAGRAIVSASPEPFLSVDRDGNVATDPIKGTRPRGQTRDDDRSLARELLCSVKDRAENVMIVDVLRNDLGRCCVPGSIRVPRLCRLERTDAVQHLVTTIHGRLAPGRDALDLLGASFPGGSITGAPKIRAMEILEGLEPVRRGPYTGAAGWISPDGAMRTSILIRTFVADGRRLTLHVGGGITWGSDPAAEWQETVDKAAGPLRAIGAREVA